MRKFLVNPVAPFLLWILLTGPSFLNAQERNHGELCTDQVMIGGLFFGGATLDRGVRATILATEMDGLVDQQKEMSAIMEEVGLSHGLHLSPAIGQGYPEDWSERMDRAIAQMRGRG